MTYEVPFGKIGVVFDSNGNTEATFPPGEHWSDKPIQLFTIKDMPGVLYMKHPLYTLDALFTVREDTQNLMPSVHRSESQSVSTANFIIKSQLLRVIPPFSLCAFEKAAYNADLYPIGLELTGFSIFEFEEIRPALPAPNPFEDTLQDALVRLESLLKWHQWQQNQLDNLPLQDGGLKHDIRTILDRPRDFIIGRNSRDYRRR